MMISRAGMLKGLYPAFLSISSRCSLVVMEIGSTDLILKGSMIVFILLLPLKRIVDCVWCHFALLFSLKKKLYNSIRKYAIEIIWLLSKLHLLPVIVDNMQLSLYINVVSRRSK